MSNSDSWASGFWEHISDLRNTLLRCLAVIGLGLVLSFTFYDSVLSLLTYPLKTVGSGSNIHHEPIQYERVRNDGAKPVVYHVPKDAVVVSYEQVEAQGNDTYLLLSQGNLTLEKSMPEKALVILGPVEGFSTALKACFWFSVACTSPVWLYFILQFISPALTQSETRLVFPFLLASLAFLSIGLLFAYFVTIPLANQYLYAFNVEIGTNLWSLSQYLDFTVMLLLANAVAFELSVILLFLVHYGVVSAYWLREWRRVSIVAIFIISALLTPPDVLTQLLMAFPLMGLYEAMILYASWREKLLTRRVYLTGI